MPHAVRTFTNSLAWQRRMFGWVPSEPTTVLLQDFSDYGNAVAYSAPRNTLVFDIAPLSHAFETFPASERMYSLMNHELIHVVQGDIASDEDRRWRRFFLGKVAAQSAESRIAALQLPHGAALHGAALVPRGRRGLHGDLDGRRPGARAGRLRRDGVPRDGARRRPLLRSAGARVAGRAVDFQAGANAYLYGTRFFTWLAYTYSPEKVVAWIRRDEGSKRYYSDQFQHVFGMPLEQAWQDWIALRARVPARRTSPRCASSRSRRTATWSASAMGSVSRTYYDEATGILYGAFRYPGVVEHVGALNTRDGSVRRLADIKRAMLYKVTSLAYDPASGTAFFTNDNYFVRFATSWRST